MYITDGCNITVPRGDRADIPFVFTDRDTGDTVIFPDSTRITLDVFPVRGEESAISKTLTGFDQFPDGTLIFCEIEGKKVVIMNGRVHYYEGYDIHEVVLPLRVIHLLGAKTAVLTNAVGAINADYSVGDFVLNEDYISSFVPSPLVGENIDKLGDRFVDMTDAFDKDLNTIVENIANQNKIPIHKGVMIQVTGPQYESPTEIKMYRSLGADTVGMSTVVETIAARHMGMRVCSISCITNMAAGMQDKISHEEVQNSSNNSSKNFAVLVSGLLSKM